MHYETVNLPEMKIAGLSARTSNLDPEMGQIIGSLCTAFLQMAGRRLSPHAWGSKYICIRTTKAIFARNMILRSGAGCRAQTACRRR